MRSLAVTAPEPPGASPEPGPLSVAVEVSALGHGSYDQRAFVRFALAALAADGSTNPATWSLRRLHRHDRVEGADPSRRGWLVSRAKVLGMAPRASWAAPSADVSFLASGAALLRVEPPGVITIHGVGDVLRIEAGGFSSRSVGTLLRRAASEGVIVHALCHAAADAVIAVLKLDRASVVVALPGIDRVEPAMPGRDDDDAAAVGVVTGTNPALDVSMVDSICQRGVKAELIDAAAAATSRSCVVFASADDGFPFAALEALARDTPVVVPRSPTTTEILEGAVSLVDAHTASDLADAAVALATSDAHRGLAVAAGRARAGDFSCHGRATELVTVLRRARAAR